VALTVRSVNPEAERESLLAVLRRNLTDLDHARRFRWLYLDNPAGPAQAWFLREREGNGAAVGAASLFPRWIWLRGRLHLCGQVGDFAVDAAYRSLGPAVMLQRATFGPVDGRVLAFCYDCPPHDKGMATFRRLGLGPQCRMLRHARLIKVDRIVRRRVRPAAAAAALSWLGNGVLRLADRRGRRGANLEITPLTGRFDDEFSALDADLVGPDAIRGRRRAEELNWRYRDDPLHQYLVLTARRAGALVAFAVVLTGGADAFLVDLFGRLTPAVAAQLVEGAVDRLRRAGVETLHALASDRGDLVHVLRAAGFRYRSPGASVVAYAPDGGDVRAGLDAATWNLTDGDIRA
jgi:hypothetical protein